MRNKGIRDNDRDKPDRQKLKRGNMSNLLILSFALRGRIVDLPFLDSGPEEVDDLCFHTYGEFSPPSLSSSSPSPSPSNYSLKAQILVLRPKY